MKQATRKLVLRGEVLRSLQVLDKQTLRRVAGGDAANPVQAQGESGRTCTAVAVAATTPCG
jgi:hypothetical protein